MNYALLQTGVRAPSFAGLGMASLADANSFVPSGTAIRWTAPSTTRFSLTSGSGQDLKTVMDTSGTFSNTQISDGSGVFIGGPLSLTTITTVDFASMLGIVDVINGIAAYCTYSFDPTASLAGPVNQTVGTTAAGQVVSNTPPPPQAEPSLFDSLLGILYGKSGAAAVGLAALHPEIILLGGVALIVLAPMLINRK